MGDKKRTCQGKKKKKRGNNINDYAQKQKKNLSRCKQKTLLGENEVEETKYARRDQERKSSSCSWSTSKNDNFKNHYIIFTSFSLIL